MSRELLFHSNEFHIEHDYVRNSISRMNQWTYGRGGQCQWILVSRSCDSKHKIIPFYSLNQHRSSSFLTSLFLTWITLSLGRALTCSYETLAKKWINKETLLWPYALPLGNGLLKRVKVTPALASYVLPSQQSLLTVFITGVNPNIWNSFLDWLAGSVPCLRTALQHIL